MKGQSSSTGRLIRSRLCRPRRLYVEEEIKLHLAFGNALTLMGDFVDGKEHFDRALGIYDPTERRPLTTRSSRDVEVTLLSVRSGYLWQMGYPAPSRKEGERGNKAASDSSGHPTAVGVSSVSANTGGFLPGGQIGCDYQAPSNWVFGVQGSLSAYTLKGVTEFPDGSEFTVKANWLASATGRIGYAWNPWLLYATGGVAWVRDSYEISGDEFNFTAGGTRTGWTVGLGIEYAFWGNWSADLQYRHYDFGSKNLVFTDSFSGVTTVANTKQWIDAVTLGLNYHLPSGSWRPAAASADEERFTKRNRRNRWRDYIHESL